MTKDFYSLIAEGKALCMADRGYKFEQSYETYCEAEKIADLNNLDHLAELYFAFDFHFAKNDGKSEKYQLALAEVGNTFVQEGLMMCYLNGGRGIKKDESKFLYWCERAIEGGSQLAKSEKRKYLRKQKLATTSK